MNVGVTAAANGQDDVHPDTPETEFWVAQLGGRTRLTGDCVKNKAEEMREALKGVSFRPNVSFSADYDMEAREELHNEVQHPHFKRCNLVNSPAW